MEFYISPATYATQNWVITSPGWTSDALPIIADGGSMLTNIYINKAGNLVDTQNKAWGKVGSPAITPWTGNDKTNYGFWSGSDSAYFSATVAALMPVGNFMMTFVGFSPTGYATACGFTSLDNTYYSYGNVGNNQINMGASIVTTSGVPAAYPSYVVWSCGRDGSSLYQKVNRGATASVAKGSPVAKTGIKIGNGTVGGQAWNGPIYNVWVSSDPWDETAMTNRHNQVLSFFGA
jgi:hypothetical protein